MYIPKCVSTSEVKLYIRYTAVWQHWWNMRHGIITAWALKKKLYKCLSTICFDHCELLQFAINCTWLATHWQLQCLTFTICMVVDPYRQVDGSAVWVCWNCLPLWNNTVSHADKQLQNLWLHNKITFYCKIPHNCRLSQYFIQENSKLK